MQNPAHTLVINWDADGNVECRDLTTGYEVQVAAGDQVLLKGSGGRRIVIYNEPEGAGGSEPDETPAFPGER